MQQTKTIRLLRSVLWRGQRIVNWLRNNLIYASDAREINRALFANVNNLDKSEVEKNTKKMQELCLARGYDKATQSLWETHIYRMMLTEKWIAEILQHLPDGQTALDLGVESITSDYWRLKFPAVHWSNTNWDLRYPWKTENGTIDLIVCTELVEHLSDPANEIFNEGFYKFGFIALLKESYQALKPGGYLFITTPNAASILHIKLILQGDPPWFFDKHVREYTMNEVVHQAREVGFEIVRNSDIHCMSVMSYTDFSPIFQMLLENGFSTAGRGDDLFVVVRKPV
jgi:SAM-dependent methyltransferase